MDDVTARELVGALVAALDARDPYTAGHSARVSAIAVSIGRRLALEDGELEALRLGALLHDIGKVGVPDDVLRKTGALTAAEYEYIKAHPTTGSGILRGIPRMEPHVPIVELHHERHDGRGYPYGLAGSTIPLGARIVHLADAYDAITSGRAYRAARGLTDAINEIERGAGTEFDPELVDAIVATIQDGALDTGDAMSRRGAYALAG